MPKVKRVPFNIEWVCFGKHSRRSFDCQTCDIEGPCIDETGFNHRDAKREKGADYA
jgi:hypothetical protein